MLLLRVIRGVLLVAALVVADQADSLANPPLPNDPWRLCPEAIAGEERAQAIPAHLLSSIALAESGRKHPVVGKRMPWPWTVMAEGQGRYLSSKLEAINEVRQLQARGVRNIDVGCMQVNLHHHPNAFFGLEQAFDPAANVAYAAQFLRSLFAGSGSWPEAAGQYHSSTPEHKIPYRERVVRIWDEQQRLASAGVVAFGAGPLTAGLGSGRAAGGRIRSPAMLLSYAERRLTEQAPAKALAPRGMQPLRQPYAPDSSARLSSPTQGRSTVTMRTLDEEAAFAIRRAQYLQELRRAVADVRRSDAVRGLSDGRQEAGNGTLR